MNALPTVIAIASAVMVAAAMQAIRKQEAPPDTPSVGLSDIHTTSVELNSSMAEMKFAEQKSDEPVAAGSPDGDRQP